MSKKKDHDSEELNEQDKITRRVDAMLNPKLPNPSSDRKNNVPPLDIFKDAPNDVAKVAKTAPEIPGKSPVKTQEVTNTPKIVSKPIKSPASVYEAETPEPPRDPVDKKDPLDDEATDKAVIDIAAKEGNTLLALQDAIGHKASRVAGQLAEEDRRKARRRHWAWLIFFVVFVVVILLALPLNSYTCRWPVGVRLRVTTDMVPSVCK